jgi:propionyl-CoA synthetase
MSKYEEAYRRSIDDPEGFWAEAARAISWYEKWERVLDDSNPPFYRWFSGGKLNTCYNAVDRHVHGGRGDQIAVIYDSPVTDTIERITYQRLLDRVARFAGALQDLGVERQDRVILYMPMIPEAIVAMLACARIGAVHSVVFGGFAPNELALRIDDARPKVVVCASCGIEVNRIIEYKPMMDEAIERALHKPEKCVVLSRPQAAAELKPGRDCDWDRVVEGAKPAECVPLGATDPLYILYTSGTTGKPKGIVRDNGGHAVALHWTMGNIYDTRAGEVYWAASDVGWVVGHSYIVYGPLLAGCTTVLYEGKPVGTPDAGAFWRVISEHGVKVLFTAPTAIRAIKREDANGALLKRYDLSGLEYLFLAGERLDPDTYHWAGDLLDIPVVDHWWQTETGWPIAANCLGIEPLPMKPGSPTKAVPGYDVRVLDTDGNDLGPGEDGVVTIKFPLPPGTLSSLWNADQRFVESYCSLYAGHYFTGDGGHKDEEGYLYVMGRVDDVINVAGHRLSTGGMEEVIAEHPAVAECAVIGVQDNLKGQVPLGLVVLKAGEHKDQKRLGRELVSMVREQIGPIACYRETLVVDRLPKTRSGKILRGTLRRIADGQVYQVPSTIDDPTILKEVEEAFSRAICGRSWGLPS